MIVYVVECSSGFQVLYVLLPLVTPTFKTIPSTDNEKIFLAGGDSCLYEII